MLHEDTKPIMDDQGEVVRITEVTGKEDVAEPGTLSSHLSKLNADSQELPINYNTPSLAYCTHLGPCGDSCPCVRQGAACERTCHVSPVWMESLQVLKFYKLIRVSVIPAARGAGMAVDAERIQRTLPRIVCLENVLVGSTTANVIRDYVFVNLSE